MQVTSCAALHNIEGSTSEAAKKSSAFYLHNKHLATKELEISTNEFHVSAFTEWSPSPVMYGSDEPVNIFYCFCFVPTPFMSLHTWSSLCFYLL